MISSAANFKSSSDKIQILQQQQATPAPESTKSILGANNRRILETEKTDQAANLNSIFHNNKSSSNSNFFTKGHNRKSDYNLNILDSELVTFRKNFYHHIPKRRNQILSNNKIMDSAQQSNQTFSSQNIASTSSAPRLSNVPSTSQVTSSQKNEKHQARNIQVAPNTMDKDALDRYVWEMWMRTPNTTPASTVLNSPDITEGDLSKTYHQIKLGRSPVGGFESLDSPTINTKENLGENEVVVFDDIEETWRRSNISPAYMNECYDLEDHASQRYDNTCLGVGDDDDVDVGDDFQSTTNSKITKMIGALPINDYEGSPRRIGNLYHDDVCNSLVINNIAAGRNIPRQAISSSSASSMFPPRPGFPKRVFTSSATAEQQGKNEPSTASTTDSVKDSAFDYLYEFSETRKVLEEFFKCPTEDDKLKMMSDSEGTGSYLDINQLDNTSAPGDQLSFIGGGPNKKPSNIAKIPKTEYTTAFDSPRHHNPPPVPPSLNDSVHYNNMLNENYDNNEIELYLDGSHSSGELADTELEPSNLMSSNRRHSRNFTLSPETTDYDSNCGDLDSISNDINGGRGSVDFVRLYTTSMPVLEDGLSSGHASDTENNNPVPVNTEKKLYEMPSLHSQQKYNSRRESPTKPIPGVAQRHDFSISRIGGFEQFRATVDNSYSSSIENSVTHETCKVLNKTDTGCGENSFIFSGINNAPSVNLVGSSPPPPPAPVSHRSLSAEPSKHDVQAALKDIKTTLQRTQRITSDIKSATSPTMIDDLEKSNTGSPVWIPRNENSISRESIESEINPAKLISCDEEDADTDLETDRLLGQQRLDDDEKNWSTERNKLSTHQRLIKSPTSTRSPNTINFTNTTIRSPAPTQNNTDLAICSVIDGEKSPTNSNKSVKDKSGKSRNKEVQHDPAVLIEGVLFRARYLGSTQLVCEGQPTKTTRMLQAEEAVSRIKAPEGESQPSTEVDLFISTEKIMVLNTDLKEIMMDHALRTISYIADIGDLVVLMARRRFVPSDVDDTSLKPNRTPKMICHVFESEEAQFIAQSIGQAFQVAYMEFLKANGIEDHSFVKEMDYQEVLNSQEIFGDELEIFAKKELQKEVVVPKAKGEILGVVIVESGWGSMLPTVVIANLLSSGAAARCGQLNIGDQIIAINGLSLVGLPLSTCQNYIRNSKNQTAVKFTVVPCPPVVEVKIKRPNTKYQLGFSVQNGVICSLLRGGIAERGGVRVGHRIIEINNQSVVAVPHEKIVNLLATSVGEILMKTMPTSMFRLLTGQENPIFI